MFWHCSNAFGNIVRHTVAARADFIEEWTIVTTYSVEYLYIPGGSAVKWIANILFTFVYDQMLAKWMTFPTVLVVFYCCLVLLIHCLDSSWHNRRHDFLSPGIHRNDFWASDFVSSHNSTSDRWFTDCGNLVYILFVVVLADQNWFALLDLNVPVTCGGDIYIFSSFDSNCIQIMW